MLAPRCTMTVSNTGPPTGGASSNSGCVLDCSICASSDFSISASEVELSYRVLGAEASAGREVLQHELTIFLYPLGQSSCVMAQPVMTSSLLVSHDTLSGSSALLRKLASSFMQEVARWEHVCR